MAKKTFKIGEYAIGGIIQVCTTSDTINIDALDWSTKEKIMGREFRINMYDVEYEIFKYPDKISSLVLVLSTASE